MTYTRLKTWRRRGLVLLLLVALFVSSGFDQKTPPGFRDGEWLAKFSMVSTASTQVMKMKTGYSGTVGFISAAGKLSGEWTLEGTATYTGDISGSAAYHGGGKIGGLSTEPVLSTSTFVVDEDITVSGMHTKQSLDMGSGTSLPLKLLSATCNQVIADIQSPTNSAYQDSGMTGYASGSFVATRIDDLFEDNSVDYSYQLSELLDQAEALKLKAFDQGGIDFASLDDLVAKAENLQMALMKNAACGDTGGKQFITAITKTITDLAYFALSNPELFTTSELNRLLAAAVGVGAIGGGAANPEIAIDLKAKFAKEFSDRLADAEANKNCNDAVDIKLAGYLLKNPALEQQAEQVMDAVC